MPAITDLLHADHQRCDDLYARAEEAAGAGRWDDAAGLFRALHDAIEAHLSAEEGILFPAIERVAGPIPPVAVMRMEHEQMRHALGAIDAAVAARDADGALGHGESLLVLVQQHNLKEEQILYPMADRFLGAEADRVAGEVARALGAR